MERQLVLHTRDYREYGSAGLFYRLFDRLVEHIYGYYRFAVGYGEVEGDLVLSRHRMHHVGYRSDTVDCVKALQRLRDVGHTQGHGVAGAYAAGCQRPRAAFYAGCEVFVRYISAVKAVCGLVGVFLGYPLYHLIHCCVGIVEVVSLFENFFHLLISLM